MFGHWAAAVSPREEEESATMANHSRSRAGDPARRTPDGRRGGAGGEDRGGRETGRDPTWADVDAEDEEERPGRLLHQAAIYNNVELLQV